MRNYQKENELILDDYRIIAAKKGKTIIADGLMFCGKVIDKGGYWERVPGNENELYVKMSPKILLLTKDYPDDGGMEDIRVECFRINGCPIPKTYGRRFQHNVIAHVWGLTHYNPDSCYCPNWNDFSWDEAREYYESSPIVRINVKKEPGGKSINDETLNTFMYDKEYRPLLIKQIELFDADILVCYNRKIFEFVIDPTNGIIKDVNENWKDDPWTYYSPIKQKILINSYHPTYFRISEEKFYNNMMKDFEATLHNHPNLIKKWYKH